VGDRSGVVSAAAYGFAFQRRCSARRDRATDWSGAVVVRKDVIRDHAGIAAEQHEVADTYAGMRQYGVVEAVDDFQREYGLLLHVNLHRTDQFIER
jgi:hypothetical protein